MEINNSYIHIAHLHIAFCYANLLCGMSHPHDWYANVTLRVTTSRLRLVD